MYGPFTADVHSDGITVVRFAGELDLDQVEVAKRGAHDALVRSDDGPLILDLAELAFCDSAGLQALLTIEHAAEAQNRRMILRFPTPNVRRVLEIVGLDRHFTIEDQSGSIPI
jgi:anti-anti-sigma factor